VDCGDHVACEARAEEGCLFAVRGCNGVAVLYVSNARKEVLHGVRTEGEAKKNDTNIIFETHQPFHALNQPIPGREVQPLHMTFIFQLCRTFHFRILDSFLLLRLLKPRMPPHTKGLAFQHLRAEEQFECIGNSRKIT